jgi:gliding motility-associated-like protein
MRKILRGHVFNKKFLITLCLGFSFIVEAQAQVSGTFTINSAVATGGSNFQTFSAAVASLSSGVNGAVVFNVQSGSGPYNEQVVLNNITGTSATNTITFNCNAVTLSFLSTNTNQRAGVKLNNTDYVTFDNLTVLPQAANANEYGYGFHLLNDADHNTIKNCHITNFVDWNYPENHEGIVINGNNANAIDPGYSNCDDNVIQRNIISGGSIGITLSSIPVGSNPTVFMTGNKILNNEISNTIYYGMQIFYTSGSLVDGNDITGGPDAEYDLYGMYINWYNQSLSVTNNRIHGFHSVSGSVLYGIFYSSESVLGKECTIANNLIYDFRCDGSQYGIGSRYANNILSANYLNIYHNTISLDDQVEFGVESFGLYFERVTDVSVMNNIITITRLTSDWNYGIYFENIPQNFTSDRNDFYIPIGPAFQCSIGVYGLVAYATLPEWRAATGYDFSSAAIDPAYASLASFDMRPTAQGIDNMAKYVNINTDININTRSTTFPDVGCYEFTSANCSTPVTGGTTTVLPDSVLCVGPKIYFGLTGNSAGGGQTYTWQTSTTATGTYTNVTSALGYPVYEVTPTTTLYYRVAVTCGATTGYSSPLRILVNSTLNAGTYTINSALPTGGINFNSFRDVAIALQCGINGALVFNVTSGSGPYNEQVIIPAIATSPTKTITFNCNGATLAYAPTDANESAVLKLNDADYITFDSLNVNVLGTSGFGFGIQLMNNADHNTIKRCTVNMSKTLINPYYAGIVLNNHPDDPIYSVINTGKSFNDSNLVANNTVIGGYYGITCVSEADIPGTSTSIGHIIRKNTLTDNCGNGIYLAGNASLVADSNDISHPTRTVFSTSPFVGIMIYKANFGLTISRNKIHNLLEKVKTSVVQLEGIKFETVSGTVAKPNIISNNALYYFNGNGIWHGLYAITANYLKFYHNTVSLEDTTSKPSVATRGFSLFGVVGTGNEFKNNSIVIKRGGTGAKYGIYLFATDNVTKIDFNNYYLSTTGTGSSFTGFMSGTNYPTLTNWLAARKDSSSISMDPVYNDLSTGDLTPTKIPFENKGTAGVGITNDIWNVTRSTSNPDIGAFEFTICKLLTTPVLSIDSAGVHAIRFSWPAIQYTTGYRVSRDGITWTIPSSGAMGTTHTITGLNPRDTVGLMVKALGSRADCPEYLSNRVTGQALTDGIFVPNTFTPNGNGQNDVFKVYSNIMKSVHWMVFNQWGEKVFEATDIQATWDGNYKGKPQPIGVYVYVVAGTLSDGTKVTQKGSFNLIR